MAFYLHHPPCHFPVLCALHSGVASCLSGLLMTAFVPSSLVLNSSQSALTAFRGGISASSEKAHLMPREEGPLPATCMSVPAAVDISGKGMPGHTLLATPGLRVLVSGPTWSS